jgi:predicted RNA methylase
MRAGMARIYRVGMKHKNAKLADKYYTKPEVARLCEGLFYRFLPEDAQIIEPSAGDGSFVFGAAREVIAFDLYPEADTIQEHDFLKDDLGEKIDLSRPTVFLGNPPFGKRNALAIEFINKALTYGNLVGFIVPIGFRKWATQKQINPAAKLVLDEPLPEDAFTFRGEPYSVRCTFQVWSLDKRYVDFRIKSKPPTAHPDFEMWQYNATPQAKRHFEQPWTFAVPRQGYSNYSDWISRNSECDPKKHWMLLRPANADVEARLQNIDFEALARGNCTVPGFGKADLVTAYEAVRKREDRQARWQRRKERWKDHPGFFPAPTQAQSQAAGNDCEVRDAA